eukprot:1388787-Amorphochlora_amoeboformis.AAC.1
MSASPLSSHPPHLSSDREHEWPGWEEGPIYRGSEGREPTTKRLQCALQLWIHHLCDGRKLVSPITQKEVEFKRDREGGET